MTHVEPCWLVEHDGLEGPMAIRPPPWRTANEALMLLLQAQIQIEKAMRTAQRLVAVLEKEFEAEVRAERIAIQAVERADEILYARQNGARWVDAARLVGFSGPASAWLLVDRMTGDARAH